MVSTASLTGPRLNLGDSSGGDAILTMSRAGHSVKIALEQFYLLKLADYLKLEAVI